MNGRGKSYGGWRAAELHLWFHSLGEPLQRATPAAKMTEAWCQVEPVDRLVRLPFAMTAALLMHSVAGDR